MNQGFQKCLAEGKGFKTKHGIRKETLLAGCLAAPGYCWWMTSTVQNPSVLFYIHLFCQKERCWAVKGRTNISRKELRPDVNEQIRGPPCSGWILISWLEQLPFCVLAHERAGHCHCSLGVGGWERGQQMGCRQAQLLWGRKVRSLSVSLVGRLLKSLTGRFYRNPE